MVSIGISSFGRTKLWFFWSVVKMNGSYYRNTLLRQHLLRAIRSISGPFFTFQQDNAPAHRARKTVALLLSAETQDFIGLQYCIHSYLLKDEDPPICIPCNSLLTVEHILISCIDFDIIRQNFYTASNLKDLFHNIHPKRIISFVHATGLTNKL